MMMVVDMNDTEKDFNLVSSELEKIGEEIGCIIKVQREDIFDKMHHI